MHGEQHLKPYYSHKLNPVFLKHVKFSVPISVDFQFSTKFTLFYLIVDNFNPCFLAYIMFASVESSSYHIPGEESAVL